MDSTEQFIRSTHAGSELARVWMKSRSTEGQSFLVASLDVLGGLNSQEEASAALNAVGGYYAVLRVYGEHAHSPQSTLAWVESAIVDYVDLGPVVQAQFRALLILAHTSDAWVTPIFAQSDACGSVMRKQIEPVVNLVSAALRSLQP